LEERILTTKQFIEGIEQGNAYIYFQQINPLGSHKHAFFDLLLSFFNLVDDILQIIGR
jgi:hypothetical protein